MTPLQKARIEYVPKVIPMLNTLSHLDFEEGGDITLDDALKARFQKLSTSHYLRLKTGNNPIGVPLRVGVVFSGGQAAGGHNVICALYDAIQGFHPNSTLYGFLDGPSGIVKGNYKELTKETLHPFRNQGGFDLIGSGRTKIETEEQLVAAAKNVTSLQLDGLVVIGGDDSNTNACHIAEYFLNHDVRCSVVGVPKTIDGDLQNTSVAMPFGFDTACKVYAETIGNIARDALSNKKYFYFVKLMGRSASHITLECALQTQPNMALIGEEIEEKALKLQDVVDEITRLVIERGKEKKAYGVILIPEGLIEFLHDVRLLIEELNTLLASTNQSSAQMKLCVTPEEKISYVISQLSEEAKNCFEMMPQTIQLQLLLDRDPHGNVQVSKIETEKLLMDLVQKRLKEAQVGEWKGSYNPQAIFCGYEGRSALPSNFDCEYCYNLGLVSALLIARKKTGYMAAIDRLTDSFEQWTPAAVPIVSLLHFEIRDGKEKPVIQKTLVDLSGKPFHTFQERRSEWRVNDRYRQIGPIQFFGPSDITDSVPVTLQLRRTEG